MSTIQQKNAAPGRSAKVHAPALNWPATDANSLLLDCWPTLLSNLRRPLGTNESAPTLIGITSCGRAEGASAVSSNLAVAAQMLDLRVALVDADRACRSLSRTLGIPFSPGFVDCLEGRATLLDCLHASSVDHLKFLPAGAAKSGETILDSAASSATFDALRDQFDMALVDLPPLNEPGDGMSIARRLDGVLLVVAAGRVTASEARHVISKMHGSGTAILGAVLNEYR